MTWKLVIIDEIGRHEFGEPFEDFADAFITGCELTNDENDGREFDVVLIPQDEEGE